MNNLLSKLKKNLNRFVLEIKVPCEFSCKNSDEQIRIINKEIAEEGYRVIKIFHKDNLYYIHCGRKNAQRYNF